ncbi:MAG: DMT family transporter [Rhodobacteraceae bacterium]|nr:DMT family transporter [Paracoccaceae bacterium]
MPSPAPNGTQPRAILLGLCFGLAASLGWGIYNVGVEIGRQQGFSSADLTLLRYFGGAAVMLPLMLVLQKSPMQGLTLLRLAVLTIVAGPPFAWFITTGFAMAPLAHAVVIGPGVTMLVSAALSRLVDQSPLSGVRLSGMALLVAGLMFIAADRSAAPLPGATAASTWLGDLCFVVSGTLWGIFTWLMSRWKLDPVSATGAIAITSTVIFLPVYLTGTTTAVSSTALWAMQFVYQGVLGGALAIVFYVLAVVRLGPIGAGVFPALVPPLAVLLAIPMTGRFPNTPQTIGIIVATLGLLVSLNLPGLFLRWRRRGRNPAKACV